MDRVASRRPVLSLCAESGGMASAVPPTTTTPKLMANNEDVSVGPRQTEDEMVTVEVTLKQVVENVVEAIRVLEPRPGEAEIQLNGINLRYLEINPIEHVLFIAFRVYDSKFRRIQEAACVQPAR